MNFNNLKTVYFIGIGGIGMSALARYFHALGKKVSGYDKTPTALTDDLMREGIAVRFDDAPEKIWHLESEKQNCLIVYTPAVPKDHGELNYFMQNGFTVM